MQTQSLNAMREQQLMGAEQERGNIRRLMATPGFDISAPDAANRLLAVAPTTGAATYQALQAGQRERRQAQVADLDRAAKLTEWWMNRLSSAAPENYPAMRAAALRDVPNWESAWPEQYSPDAVRRLQSNAAESLLRYRTTVTASPAGGFVVSPQALPYGATPLQGPQYISPESIPAVPAPGSPPTAPPAAPRAEGLAMSPGQTAAARRSQSTDPLLIDAAIRRNEGTARNPASSAVGPYQFIDSTFVDQFRRSFPDVARNLSPEQILTFRGAQTPDGRRVEDVMGPALTTQNQQALVQAGFAPTAGNTYLAHFLGSGGAQAVLRADPNTPISQLVSREAIAANPTILGVPGVTAGQIVQWANNTVDMGPRDARQALVAPNAMAAPGATTNAMLAPPDATAVSRPLGTPEFPGLPREANLRDADLIRRIRDIQSKEAEARMQAELRRENAAAVAREEGQKAEETRRGTLTAEQERDERKKREGRTQVDATLEKMAEAYRRLERLGGIPGETRGVGANISAYAAGTAPGQAVSQALGTRSQSVRNELQSLARTLITDIKNSTGMSAQEMNSNVELQQMLMAVSSPTQSIESVQAIIKNLSQRFGLGREFAPPAPAAPPEPSARPAESVPGPRRGAAQAPSRRPTLEQFLERARPANPNASVEDLTAYYNRTYGGR
jgi:hypothetical protein